jgi:ABC-type transporter Mla MlaB component
MKNIQLTVTPRGSSKNKSVNITLEGDLILRYMHEVTEEVKQTVSRFENITIELKNIANIDLACIQLLLAAKQTAISAKKQFSCQLDLPEEVKGLMQHAGMADLQALLNKTGI